MKRMVAIKCSASGLTLEDANLIYTSPTPPRRPPNPTSATSPKSRRRSPQPVSPSISLSLPDNPLPTTTSTSMRTAMPLHIGGSSFGASRPTAWEGSAPAISGARERTLSELLGVLGAPSRADRSKTGGPRISFGCGVWLDKTRTLRPAYIDAAAKDYKAQTCAVDFHRKPEEAGQQINAWARESTNNLITEIVHSSQLSEQTDLMVANAIYFKGKWEKTFNEELTEDDEFHRLDGSTVDVPFMQDSRRQRIACHRGFKVLQLHYQEGQPLPAQPRARYSMCVFLPNTRRGLSRLTERIASDPDFIRKHLPTGTVKVGEFRLPKFKLDLLAGMNDALGDMGINEVFEQGKADLSDMVAEDGPVGNVVLQDVFHKAVIEVNEEGTEAAAVTSCGLKTCALGYKPPKLVDFVADHPFAFFVMEDVSGAILFAGHVLVPSTSGE